MTTPIEPASDRIDLLVQKHSDAYVASADMTLEDCIRNALSEAALAQTAPAEVVSGWRCEECRCHSYAVVQDVNCNPTNQVRCVNCKHVTTLSTPTQAEAKEAGIRDKLTHMVDIGGATMCIVDPRSFADGGVEWKLRYANNLEPVRMLAASLVESYDYLLSDNITNRDAEHRLLILRDARRTLLKEGEAAK